MKEGIERICIKYDKYEADKIRKWTRENCWNGRPNKVMINVYLSRNFYQFKYFFGRMTFRRQLFQMNLAAAVCFHFLTPFNYTKNEV